MSLENQACNDCAIIFTKYFAGVFDSFGVFMNTIFDKLMLSVRAMIILLLVNAQLVLMGT